VIVPFASLPEHPAVRDGFVLDCRPAADFERAHLAGAVSLPVPPDSGEAALERAFPSIFLPARHEPLLVVDSVEERARRLAAWLGDRGRDRVEVAVLPPAGSPLPAGLVWGRGPSRSHLWRAPEYLVAHAALLPPPVAGPVLDLACGSGRACVWLAERGYRVTGVDHEREALELGRQLAASRGVACRFAAADLRRDRAGLAGPWAAILDFRFLDRDLLGEAPGWLRPGGVLMLRTFRDAPGYDGHPHRRHRLRRSELVRAFAAAEFEVLCHEENHDPDGRPAAGIVARRRIVLPHRGR
jgi:SAM-dependent methyltransferase